VTRHLGKLVISEDKLTQYLLAWRARNDKSGFLALGGYDPSNWQALRADLLSLATTAEAELQERTVFGELFLVRGNLTGPSGVILRVKTIWIRVAETDEMRFVTLYPDKG
jgi:hypothetical protein